MAGVKGSWAKVVSWVVAAVIGAVFGVAGTIGQSSFVGPVPVGLLVAIIGTGALLLAVRLLTEDRWAAVATGAGAMLATLVFSGRGPGGSVVVPAPESGELSTGVIWTIAVPLMVGIIAAWPSRTTPAPERTN